MSPVSSPPPAAPEPSPSALLTARWFSTAALAPVLATVLVVLAPLLGGGAARPYTLFLAAFAAVAVWFLPASTPTTQPDSSRQPGQVPVSLFSVFLVAALTLGLLQLVPLPPGVRHVLCPGSDGDLRDLLDHLASLGAHTSGLQWLPISTDPAATWNEVVRLAGALCLLWAFSSLPSRADRQHVVGPSLRFWAPALAAAVLGFLAVAGTLGLPLPSPIALSATGSSRALFSAGLYNSNHLADLMGLGSLAILRLLTQADRPLSAGLLWLGLALCNLVLLGTLSRAALPLWGLAEVITIFYLYRIPLRLPRRPASLVATAVIGLALLLFALGAYRWLSSTGVLRSYLLRIQATQLADLVRPGGKLHAWNESLSLLIGHWPLGVGRGAFESVFLHTYSQSGQLRFVVLENELLQLFLDYGLLGGLGLSILLGWAFFRGCMQLAPSSLVPLSPSTRRSVVVGLVALFALALHSLIDFGPQVGGVALPALALLSTFEVRAFFVSRRLLRGVAACTLLGAVLAQPLFRTQDEDGAALRALAEQSDRSVEQVLQMARKVAASHPFDAYLPALVAARLHRESHPETLRWVNQALLANPRDPLALRTGGAYLIGQGLRQGDSPVIAQGLSLLRTALQKSGTEDRQRTLVVALTLFPSAAQVASILPLDDPTFSVDDFLDLGGELLGQKELPPEQLAALSHDLLMRPGLPTHRAAYWLGRTALVTRSSPHALQSATALLQEPSPPPLLLADLLTLLASANGTSHAEDLARAALRKQHEPLWQLALVRLLLHPAAPPAPRTTQSERWAEAQALLDEILQSPAESDPNLAVLCHELYAELDTLRDRPQAAALHRQTAARLQKNPP